MVAAARRQDRVELYAARQAIAPSGIPSIEGVQYLQPTRLQVLVCRSSHVLPHN